MTDPTTQSVFSKVVSAVESAVGIGPAAAPPNAAAQPNAPLLTLETAVQIACQIIAVDEADPEGDYLLLKCGQLHVDAVAAAGTAPDAIAKWACAEARRRSPSLDPFAIRAQSLV